MYIAGITLVYPRGRISTRFWWSAGLRACTVQWNAVVRQTVLLPAIRQHSPPGRFQQQWRRRRRRRRRRHQRTPRSQFKRHHQLRPWPRRHHETNLYQHNNSSRSRSPIKQLQRLRLPFANLPIFTLLRSYRLCRKPGCKPSANR